MAKHHEDFYFNNFVQSVQVSCEAAEFLKQFLLDFSPDNVEADMAKMHCLEHKGDELRHTLVAQIARAFITPIERDDIIELSDNIDRVTDSIEDIVIHIYMSGVKSIRADAHPFADLVIRCCKATQKMMEELPNFKKSKSLHDLIIEINRIEEEGDDLYKKYMRKLHTEGAHILEIVVWREIYEYFEKCCDACEDVADIVESIVIENS